MMRKPLRRSKKKCQNTRTMTSIRQGLRVVTILPEPVREDYDEETPLLSRTSSVSPPKGRNSIPSENGFVTAPTSRRPSMMPRTLTRTLTKYMSGRKNNCDETGPCLGFSDPCGQDCFKAVKRRVSIVPNSNAALSRAPTWRHVSADPHSKASHPHASRHAHDDRQDRSRTVSEPCKARKDSKPDGARVTRSRSATHHYHHPENEHPEAPPQARRASAQSASVGNEHHHHVPTNAFMSIGLQTSLAIALHKAPEGLYYLRNQSRQPDSRICCVYGTVHTQHN